MELIRAPFASLLGFSVPERRLGHKAGKQRPGLFHTTFVLHGGRGALPLQRLVERDGGLEGGPLQRLVERDGVDPVKGPDGTRGVIAVPHPGMRGGGRC